VIWCKSSDGTAANQTCKDEGPLTLERSKGVDEEISAKVIDFLDRNDPEQTKKPFFIWYNPARMHSAACSFLCIGEFGSHRPRQ
jgi:arylsulfatase